MIATTAFVDPDLTIGEPLYSHLSRLGFRRSGRYIYTPRCENCHACVPLRVVANLFALNRQQRRCANRNSDLTTAVVPSADQSEHYPLYEKYINVRHSDGDMYPPTVKQYEDFIGSLLDQSRFIEFRLGGTLIGASVVDIIDDGVSAIYTYFDPDEKKRSLGTYAILAGIELTRELGLSYLYLGYWIKESQKMSYKSNFRPLEILVNHRWQHLNRAFA